MPRIAVFLDDANLSHNCDRKINWRAFVRLVDMFGDSQLVRLYDAVAPRQEDTDAHLKFVDSITASGLTYVPCRPLTYDSSPTETVVKASVVSRMCTDMLQTAGSYDMAICATGDGEFVPPIEALRSMGRRVVGMGFNNVARNLREAVDYYLSAWLLPGVFFNDEGLVRGLCNFVSESGQAYLRYLKPGLGGDLFTLDARDPRSAWTTAQFRVQGALWQRPARGRVSRAQAQRARDRRRHGPGEIERGAAPGGAVPRSGMVVSETEVVAALTNSRAQW
jgi:uncharacterized LabA/DUF88 family protein